MVGPIRTNQAQPHDQAAFDHQMQLLQSAHCCRPVIHRGLQQFINTLRLYHDGGRVAMTVYLNGSTEPIDSSEVQIKPTPRSEESQP